MVFPNAFGGCAIHNHLGLSGTGSADGARTVCCHLPGSAGWPNQSSVECRVGEEVVPTSEASRAARSPSTLERSRVNMQAST
jgi:hypothetical protein